MTLILLNSYKIFTRCFLRTCSTLPEKKHLKKSVYISQSKDIFVNLALEDWLYKNFDFTNHHVLMLWQNEPCVVIGRHQNPWLEANICELNHITEQGVKLARRNSGGGTVFHDEGNLNMTFFTARNSYNRKDNLKLITRAVSKEFGVELNISDREDLTLKGFKVSGTAAKLGRNTAYHHCTLLVNANKLNLSQALLKSDNIAIKTNATGSIKSKIMNLCEENPKIEVKQLSKAIGWEYLKDAGMEFSSKTNGFQMINPTENWFPGIDEIKENLRGWQWRYGRTPKFTVTRLLTLTEKTTTDSKVTVAVENGKISNIELFVSLDILRNVNMNVSHFIGHKFSEYVLDNLEWSLDSLINDKNIFVNNFLMKKIISR